jgi:hypothetical protein
MSAAELTGVPTDIHHALEHLIVADRDFEQLENALGRFCPFEAMNVVRGEVPLGNLLSALLDPSQPHGFGPKLLRSFLMEAVRAAQRRGMQPPYSPLDIHLLDLSGAEIQREWQRIDILITIEHIKLVVAVELKIASKQSYDQLKRYRETVDTAFGADWTKLLVFLTVGEEAPNDPAWVPLKYTELVPAFEAIDSPEADPSAAAILASFLSMFRRHHVADDKLDELARKLWTSHKAALTFLADRRPDGMRGVFSALQTQSHLVAKQISGDGFTFEPDRHTTSMHRYACINWDGLPGFREAIDWTPSNRLILFELKREGEKAVAYVYLGKGKTKARATISDALAQFRHQQNQPPGTEWMCLAKRVLFEPKASEDFDPGETQRKIIDGLTTFYREAAKTLDAPLRAALM